jgi:hypothetical protein
MTNTTDPKRMTRAYQTAGSGVRSKLRREAPADEAVLAGLRDQDTVVVRGQYDFAENVLRALGVPFALAQPDHLGHAQLRPDQTVLVNCPGHLGRRGVTAVRHFVEQGGCLITTDWALVHVLEAGFPGLMTYNRTPTRDDVVRVEIVNRGVALVGSLLDPADDPVWWLESSSYPVKILAPQRVETLIRSAEMAERYGEAPIAVGFAYGQGHVYHIVSHFYLQRTETRTARQRAKADSYLTTKGIEDPTGVARDLAAGEVESAFTSSAFLSQLLIERTRTRP